MVTTKQNSIDTQGGIAYSDSLGKYFPSVKSDLSYKGMKLVKNKHKPNIATAAQVTSDGIKSVTGIRLLRRINLIEFIQNPYNDSQLQRFEASARRNWAVKYLE